MGIVKCKDKRTGIIYVYENTSIWDPALKKPRHKRKCIGHLDPETGDIVPNRSKRKPQALTSQSDKPVSSSSAAVAATSQSVGVSMVLDTIVEKLNLTDTLISSFPDDWRMILSGAYYLVAEDKALYCLDRWSRDNHIPYEGSLASQRISELLPRITLENQKIFFCEWAKINKSEDYYALDITSVSSYSELNEFVSAGYNRDKESLEQINILMITNEKTGVPVYFRVLAGSIKDVSALTETVKEMEMFHTVRLKFVMDKGFFSKKNISELYKRHYKFTVGVPFTFGMARRLVEQCKPTIKDSMDNFLPLSDGNLYCTTVTSEKWEGHRSYYHVYFDESKKLEQELAFRTRLHMCYQELIDGMEKDRNMSFYETYFEVKTTPKRGRQVKYREEEIKKHIDNTCGWLVLLSNDIKDAKKAIEVYRQKDKVEKSFDNMKNELDMKRLHVHYAQSMQGRIFIEFIALILLYEVQRVLRESGLNKKYTVRETMMELKAIRKVEIRKKRSTERLITEYTKLQKEILEAFGL